MLPERTRGYRYHRSSYTDHLPNRRSESHSTKKLRRLGCTEHCRSLHYLPGNSTSMRQKKLVEEAENKISTRWSRRIARTEHAWLQLYRTTLPVQHRHDQLRHVRDTLMKKEKDRRIMTVREMPPRKRHGPYQYCLTGPYEYSSAQSQGLDRAQAAQRMRPTLMLCIIGSENALCS